VTVLVTKATPLVSLANRRATPEEQAKWSERDFEVNCCQYCKTAYKAGSGANWVCEHHHRPLKGL
jgi:hypothetical protein